MRKIALFVSVMAVSLLSLAASMTAQQAVPQTARQALLEMFFSKTPGTLVKHLPAVTKAAFDKAGVLEKLQAYSSMAGQYETQGKTLQTFETGSVILATDDPKTGQKMEVRVENDTLNGEEDDLELSFQTYKSGQAQRTPFMPRLTFTMKQEEGVWKLYEISVAVHLPLTDPDLLKTITEKAQPQTTGSSFTPHSQAPAFQKNSFQNSGQVASAMKSIVAAETTYAGRYPTIGYTCTLSDLDGFGGGEPNEHQAMLIPSGLASGKRFGYTFTLSGCGVAPAHSFRLTAVPAANNAAQTAYCSDPSGIVRSANGSAASCIASGTPLP